MARPLPTRPTAAERELLARAARDRLCLGALWETPARPAAVSGLLALGDPHRDGRRATRVVWSDRLTAICKPRSLAPDLAWQRAVEWLGRRSDLGPFRLPAIVRRSGYGWVEDLPIRRPSTDPAAVRFHRRAGALLALFDVLQVRDVHAGNLVAVDDQPVFVDGETIAHPRLARFRGIPSIALSGFLPAPGATDRRAGVFAGLRPGGHRPLRFVEPLVAGYEAGYRTLRDHGGELVGPRGILRGLRGRKTRVILRPTSCYHEQLRTGARLPPGRFGSARARRAIEEAERRALARRDIPLFQVDPNGTDLHADGRLVVEGWFRRSGIEEIAERLDRLSPADLRRQLTLIRGSLALDELSAAPDRGGGGK